MLSLLIILFNSIVALVLFYNFYYKRKNFPPGPTPLPIIGNLLTLKRMEPGEQCFLKWQREYAYWMGETPIVCVTDFHTMIETFQKDGDAYSGRFTLVDFDLLINGGNFGIILTEGELWRDQRRFALHVLRDFGLGKNLMQEKILDEITSRFEKIDNKLKSGIDEINLPNYFDIGIGSIINSLLFGYRFNGDETAEFFELKQILAKFIKNAGHINTLLIQQYPNLLRRLPVFKQRFDQFKRDNDRLYKFFGDHIKSHQQQDHDEENPTDFVSAFLAEKKRRDKLGEAHNYTVKQLSAVCFDLWVAGQETTSTTLAWGVAFMLNDLPIQDRIHEELDRVIGSDRLINNSDKPSLPYLSAFINETQRMANLVPNNVLRRTLKDVTINGYSIPKHTTIVPQISALLANDDVYKKAMKFDPNRYLNDKGELIKSDELMPFSLGKRQCLGESLARMELFLFFANLFNHYKLSNVNGTPSLKRTFGGTAQCPPFTCRMEIRH